ncbi:MAG: threonine synthase [Dactylosporangium sp.]|nr:threonine synthase [Dactylosporangium sp.]
MSGAYLGRLACPRCRRDYPESAAFTLCPACGQQGQHVNPMPVYDTALVGPSWPAGPPDASRPGIFRYRDLLPVGAGTEPVSLDEGGTPLLRLSRVGSEVGLPELYLKDESRNPTWSYKDRLAAVGVTKAREVGAEVVVVSSTGNHGAATAAYAAAAGLRCVVLTLESVPLTMKVLMQSYGAHVVALRSGPDRWLLMREAIRAHGWVPLSGFVNPPAGSNPFGLDGYKTMAYEIVESLGRAPDVVVTPVAYGDGIAGMHRGFADLLTLARREGVYLEASAVVPLAALHTLTERGVVSEHDTVVCVATSTGLKDIGATASLLPPVEVIEPDLAALERTMKVQS